MLQNLFSLRHFWRRKCGFLVHSTTRNAPYIHTSHDSISELWRTFPNGIKNEEVIVDVSCDSISSFIIPKMKQ